MWPATLIGAIWYGPAILVSLGYAYRAFTDMKPASGKYGACFYISSFVMAFVLDALQLRFADVILTSERVEAGSYTRAFSTGRIW